MTDSCFVIIAGVYNCGTTILAQLIDKHPNIKFVRRPNNNNWEENIIAETMKECGIYFPQSPFDEVMSNGSRQLAQFKAPNAMNFADKLKIRFGNQNTCLKNNKFLFCKDFVDAALPRSKRILILRNGRSFATSKNYWKKGRGSSASKLRARAKFWNIIIQDYYFKYWQDDDQTLMIKYEDLGKETHKTIKKVCDFVSLDFERVRETLLDDLEVTNRTDKWDSLTVEHKNLVLDEIKETEKLYESL